MAKSKALPDRVARLIERARHLFVALAEAHHLELEWNEKAPVELAAWVRRQPGLDWNLWLNLQNNDEIGIQHQFFYVEWFPADEPEPEQRFVETVDGLLSGAVRLRCSFRRGKSLPYLVDFQRETAGKWATFYSYARGLSLGRPALVSILRNGHPTVEE